MPIRQQRQIMLSICKENVAALAQVPSVTTRQSPKLHLAHELIKLAEAQGNAECLKEAIKLFQEVIAAGWCPSRPDVAKVHNDIGFTLLALYNNIADLCFGGRSGCL